MNDLKRLAGDATSLVAFAVLLAILIIWAGTLARIIGG
jgi:hypothetical protein